MLMCVVRESMALDELNAGWESALFVCCITFFFCCLGERYMGYCYVSVYARNTHIKTLIFLPLHSICLLRHNIHTTVR